MVEAVLCEECGEDVVVADPSDPFCPDCHTCECDTRYLSEVGGLIWNATWNTPGFLVCPNCDVEPGRTHETQVRAQEVIADLPKRARQRLTAYLTRNDLLGCEWPDGRVGRYLDAVLSDCISVVLKAVEAGRDPYELLRDAYSDIIEANNDVP